MTDTNQFAASDEDVETTDQNDGWIQDSTMGLSIALSAFPALFAMLVTRHYAMKHVGGEAATWLALFVGLVVWAVVPLRLYMEFKND